jgi:ferredoxin
MTKIIQKNDIPKLLHLLSDFDVYGPIKENEKINYRLITEDDPAFDFTNSQKPPKEVFFPQTEKMFDFERGQKGFTGIKPLNNSTKSIVLFGIRPCDASSFTILDKLFSWDYIDPYFVNRRNQATVISFCCSNSNMSQKNCFCTSVGGSPSSTEGSDMLWTDIGDSYFIESLNEKGNKIISLGKNFFKNATAEKKKKAQDVQKQAEKSIVRKFEKDGISNALEGNFDSDYWDQFSKRCLGCGICTLFCPTCHCFDINDIISKGNGWRERTWDSCQYDYYTIHASGHNPRPAKKYRQRNRIYHKFLYMNKNLDALGCVGCGRCISKCPVNIDIIEVVEGVKEVKSNG